MSVCLANESIAIIASLDLDRLLGVRNVLHNVRTFQGPVFFVIGFFYSRRRLRGTFIYCTLSVAQMSARGGSTYGGHSRHLPQSAFAEATADKEGEKGKQKMHLNQIFAIIHIHGFQTNYKNYKGSCRQISANRICLFVRVFCFGRPA